MIVSNTDDIQKVDFLAGATLLIKKPLEWTSFDVVNKIRYALKRHLDIKKIKVGHAGTLDPLATGLLILCTGKSTKTIDSIQGKNKTYSGQLFLGATTPSYDAETEIDATFKTEHIGTEEIELARKSFLGEIDQKPPIFSAIKRNGKALYKYARKGQEVDIPTRRITIHQFEIDKVKLPQVEFTVQCSKGTYIRSLAFDFGKALNSGAYLSGLRRMSIEEYNIDDAWKLEDFISALDDSSSKHQAL